MRNRKIYKTSDQTKRCRFCQSYIYMFARVCPECGKSQRLPGFMSFSATSVVAVAALVSAITASLPVLRNQLHEPSSDLDINLIERADTTVPITTANTGDRPAFINSSAILLIELKRGSGDSDTFIFGLKISSSGRRVLEIPPETGKQYFYVFDRDSNINSSLEKLSKSITKNRVNRCAVEVSWTTFNGKSKHTTLNIFDENDLVSGIHNVEGSREMQHMLGVGECFGKIPKPIRVQHGISGAFY